jgi:hypothetical protein
MIALSLKTPAALGIVIISKRFHKSHLKNILIPETRNKKLYKKRSAIP